MMRALEKAWSRGLGSCLSVVVLNFIARACALSLSLSLSICHLFTIDSRAGLEHKSLREQMR